MFFSYFFHYGFRCYVILGLRSYVPTFSSCSEGGSSLAVKPGTLTAEASLAVEPGL